MDDWSLSEPAQVAARDQAPNHQRSMTTPLTRARSFMDDIGASFRQAKRERRGDPADPLFRRTRPPIFRSSS